MAIPTFDEIIEPLLRFLATRADGVRSAEAYDAIAKHFHLSEAEQAVLLPSGAQPVIQNRVGWAHDRLKRAGLSASPRRGTWKITEKGLDFVRQHPGRLADEVVTRLASYVKPGSRAPETANVAPVATTTEVAGSRVAPAELIEVALKDLRASVTEDLLERFSAAAPVFFERAVLDLLYALGYGKSREDLQHVGRSHDGGIDGVISLDRLGLDKVYIQAKRWQNTVGRPDVQGFYGAVAAQKATRGVFITTSTFSREAEEFASRVGGLVLVDGERLTDLMIEHGVGVTHEARKIPKVDGDFFEDG